MYSEKIEALINAALADGELTEKEKRILFKRAEEEGIDLDEFEMVLDARLYERNNSINQPINDKVTNNEKPNTNKFASIKKCPACGATVEAFNTKCSDCGYVFSNIETNASFERLYQMLIDAENERTKPKTDSILSTFSSILSEEMDEKKITKKKISIIL